jgi:hypothetical protein
MFSAAAVPTPHCRVIDFRAAPLTRWRYDSAARMQALLALPCCDIARVPRR